MVQVSSAITGPPGFVKPPPGFSDLYRRYSETVYRAALRVIGNVADAEDVLQTVFLRMISNRLTVDLAGAPEQYLRRAAINAAIDLLRRRRSLGETEIDESREYGSREDKVLLKERLRRAFARAPARGRGAIVLCYLGGFAMCGRVSLPLREREHLKTRTDVISGTGHLL